jgi:hypothetical protein
LRRAYSCQTWVTHYDSPFEKRRLRILNGVFPTLSRMAHGGTSDRDGYHTHFYAIIGDPGVPLHLDEVGRKAATCNRYTAPRPDPKRPASMLLRLTT